jgi:hypothetical protein
MKYLTFWSDDPHPNSAAIYIYIYMDVFVVRSITFQTFLSLRVVTGISNCVRHDYVRCLCNLVAGVYICSLFYGTLG